MMDLKFLHRVLTDIRSGLFDQSDAEKALSMLEGQEWGCHCDLEAMEDGFEPDGCVIDEGRPQDCIYSKCGDKWKCSEWKPVSASKEAPQ